VTIDSHAATSPAAATRGVAETGRAPAAGAATARAYLDEASAAGAPSDAWSLQ
jgi:hypothetical protein